MELSKSVYYYSSCKDDSEVIAKLSSLAELHSRRGCDKFYDMIRAEGIVWNYKRVRRVYALMNLSIRRKTKKRLPARTKEPLFVPDAVNKIWSMDFMSDALSNGRKIRVFNVMDDYNREALAIEASSSIPSVSVINILKDVIDWRGKPEQIRVDNGPEFTSGSFAHWCKEENIKLQYIQPGKPMQNGFIERFNRTYREEILDAYIFEDLGQVRELSQNWMEDYNKLRPHESLKGNSPEKFKRLREFVDSGKLG